MLAQLEMTYKCQLHYNEDVQYSLSFRAVLGAKSLTCSVREYICIFIQNLHELVVRISTFSPWHTFAFCCFLTNNTCMCAFMQQ